MEEVIDHYNNNIITRPRPNPRLQYDFDFRKVGSSAWRYINSSNELSAFERQIDAVIDNSGECRIVNVATGKVVQQNHERMI